MAVDGLLEGPAGSAESGFVRTTLVRSPIGTSARIYRILQGLGHNGKLGQQRTHRNEPNIWGAIKKTEHLLNVDVVLPGQGAISMKQTSYSILKRPALRLTGPHGQYALGETYQGYYSLRWTTALPAARVFHEFTRHVDNGYAYDVHVDTTTGRTSFAYEPQGIDHEAILTEARDCIKFLGVTHFVIDYARGSLHWEKVKGETFHEIGILSPELGRDTFRTLVGALGTPAISDAADELVNKFDFVWA